MGPPPPGTAEDTMSMARVQAGGDRGRGGATYLGHITAQPDHKIVNKVWARSPPGLENRYPGLARDETRVTTPGWPWWAWGKKGTRSHSSILPPRAANTSCFRWDREPTQPCESPREIGVCNIGVLCGAPGQPVGTTFDGKSGSMCRHSHLK